MQRMNQTKKRGIDGNCVQINAVVVFHSRISVCTCVAMITFSLFLKLKITKLPYFSTTWNFTGSKVSYRWCCSLRLFPRKKKQFVVFSASQNYRISSFFSLILIVRHRFFNELIWWFGREKKKILRNGIMFFCVALNTKTGRKTIKKKRNLDRRKL